MATTITVDADSVRMVLEGAEITRETQRAAIDEIAQRIEAEIEARGVDAVVERDYQSSGARRDAEGHDQHLAATLSERVLVDQVDAIRAVVLGAEAKAEVQCQADGSWCEYDSSGTHEEIGEWLRAQGWIGTLRLSYPRRGWVRVSEQGEVTWSKA